MIASSKKALIAAILLLCLNGVAKAANVRFGVELNPVLSNNYLSAGFNAFFPDQGVELAIPFVYDTQLGFFCSDYDDGHDTTIDLVARKYYSYKASGTMPYIGLMLRHQQMDAKPIGGCSYSNNDSPPYGVTYKVARNGYGVNIGFRKITARNFYFGASISYGRYFDSGIDGAPSPFSGKRFSDIEFFKVGYIFK